MITTSPSGDPTKCTAEGEGSNLLNNYLLPLIDSGKDVVVFAHSFGATSCSGAGQGLAKSARQAKDLKGGVIGFIGLSFGLPQDGHTQLELLGNAWPDFIKPNGAGKGLLIFASPGDSLYHDVTDEDLKEQLVKAHLPQATSVFETPVKQPLWSDAGLKGRRTYICPAKDAVFPPAVQEMFVKDSGVDWDWNEVPGGHCAFIAEAEAVASIVCNSADTFAKKI